MERLELSPEASTVFSIGVGDDVSCLQLRGLGSGVWSIGNVTSLLHCLRVWFVMATYFSASTSVFGCKLVVNATTPTCSLPTAIALSNYKSPRCNKYLSLLYPTNKRTTKDHLYQGQQLFSDILYQPYPNQPTQKRQPTPTCVS
jgi:hypothetical protein